MAGPIVNPGKTILPPFTKTRRLALVAPMIIGTRRTFPRKSNI